VKTPRFHLPRASAYDQLHARSNAAHVEAFQELPAPRGAAPYRLDLAEVIGEAAVKEIESAGKLVFHAVGDTGGIKEPRFQENVAAAMENDFSRQPAPAFFYHLGDVVYFYGQRASYYEQFYDPYIRYPAPILAIPGNHDGAVTPGADTADPAETVSLEGFFTNFCALPNTHTTEAHETPRNAMTQPNVYWTLTTPLATIVGLYTNVPEGGAVRPEQREWFAKEIAEAATDRALIVAAHHPIYSADAMHGSCPGIGEVLNKAFQEAGRTADLVLNGHVHNYQRFTRQYQGKEQTRPITYIVAGAGGYHNLHAMGKVDGAPPPSEWQDEELGVTLNSYNESDFGYLTLTVTKTEIQGAYTAVPKAQSEGAAVQTNVSDTFTISL
jgi:predicted phosphodiesterase